KNNQFFVQKGKPPNAGMVADLLKEGFVRLTGLRSAKNGKLYNATVYLDDSGSGYPRFRMEFEKKGGKR
ncbi:MAG: DNA topoisomerase III, partial [Clostridia bacterium]|nr:DNA topoisomerase III [Clostridia bacterium]